MADLVVGYEASRWAQPQGIVSGSFAGQEPQRVAIGVMHAVQPPSRRSICNEPMEWVTERPWGTGMGSVCTACFQAVRELSG